MQFPKKDRKETFKDKKQYEEAKHLYAKLSEATELIENKIELTKASFRIPGGQGIKLLTLQSLILVHRKMIHIGAELEQLINNSASKFEVKEEEIILDDSQTLRTNIGTIKEIAYQTLLRAATKSEQHEDLTEEQIVDDFETSFTEVFNELLNDSE